MFGDILAMAMETESQMLQGELSIVLVLASLVASFGSSFQYGYNVASVNSPAPFMRDFYNKTYIERYNEPIPESFLTMLWSVTVSMFPLGGFLGALMVAPLVNNLGRKGTLLFNNIFSIVPAIMMGCSEMAKSYELIIVARIIVGICAGLSSNVVPMYLGEITPRNLRGAIGIIPQVFITFGILAAQVFGIRSCLGNKTGWTLLLGLTAVPAVFQLIFLPFFPESPRYLIFQKDDEKAGIKALQFLRGRRDVEAEVEDLVVEVIVEQLQCRMSVLSLLAQSFLRWQIVIIVVLNLGQQLSGVNAIYYYADSIYRSAGVNEEDVQYVTVGTGAVNVFMTIAAVCIVEFSGRRLLLLLGFGICCGSCVVLTVALIFQESVPWLSYISIICVILYVMGHAIGPSPVPNVLTTEIFMHSARPAAFMLGGSIHWISNFIVGIIFPYMERDLGPFSFLLFAGVCFVTLIFIFIAVFETKQKSFLEIARLFDYMNNMNKEDSRKNTSKEDSSEEDDYGCLSQ
ncbi:solute carrier family 2, facilitated glucose transporter member 1a [Gambusia affinis]|uniref:solute carrier family 2, facilitated glucose transporter member 1a n=1 Tax=Gambusia affinis TaxID=33528 RepID=UPI001CDC282A|nr:solute carrier family 2, facilitated glucose transporter member 1a [Gambusia affinis]XP_043978356.1 solute carrier family 2, facilitated glucose transporter member 1a [Gambusia affinis]XP_043978365.1 solute carrier family 2, facilitated glucose transporter member 1a [Gambusia affinis]